MIFHRAKIDAVGAGIARPRFCAPILFFLFSEKEKNRRSVRRSLLHSASAGAAKAPYSQPPSSFPKADRCAGSPFGSNKKRKETTGEPFEWFPGPSIDQSLALDLRRMEVGKPTIEYVGADAERSCSRRRSVTDAACPLRVLIGLKVPSTKRGLLPQATGGEIPAAADAFPLGKAFVRADLSTYIPFCRICSQNVPGFCWKPGTSSFSVTVLQKFSRRRREAPAGRQCAPLRL